MVVSEGWNWSKSSRFRDSTQIPWATVVTLANSSTSDFGNFVTRSKFRRHSRTLAASGDPA